MSNLLHVGSIIDHRDDRFATSGDHLDVRIIPKYGDNPGVHIDPALRPELLKRILIGDGENRRGLTSFDMTSGFGPRDTGIKGASKYHKGQDYAIGSGNNIYIEGGGSFSSENGIGIASIVDTNGNPYELEFFHTNVGDTVGNVTPVTTTDETNRSEAKTKAKAYQDMSKAEINAAYDAMRSDPAKAELEGMKMHKAFFNK